MTDAANRQDVVSNRAGEQYFIFVCSLTGHLMGGGCNLGAAVPPGTGGSSDPFIAKYASTDGSHVWSRVLPTPTRTRAWALTSDAQSNLVITGDFLSGPGPDFGGGPLPSGGSWDLFAAKFKGTDGSHLFSIAGGGALNDCSGFALTRSNSSLVVVGAFATTINFGGGVMTAAGAQDGFLVNFGPVP